MWVQTDERARIVPPSLTTKPSNAAVLKRTARPRAGPRPRLATSAQKPSPGDERLVVADADRASLTLRDSETPMTPGRHSGGGAEPRLEQLASRQAPAGRALGAAAARGRAAACGRHRCPHRPRASAGAAARRMPGRAPMRLAGATAGGELGRHAGHLRLVAVVDRVGRRAPVPEQGLEVAVEALGGVLVAALGARGQPSVGLLRGGRRGAARGTGGRGRCRC